MSRTWKLGSNFEGSVKFDENFIISDECHQDSYLEKVKIKGNLQSEKI